MTDRIKMNLYYSRLGSGGFSTTLEIMKNGHPTYIPVSEIAGLQEWEANRHPSGIATTIMLKNGERVYLFGVRAAAVHAVVNRELDEFTENLWHDKSADWPSTAAKKSPVMRLYKRMCKYGPEQDNQLLSLTGWYKQDDGTYESTYACGMDDDYAGHIRLHFVISASHELILVETRGDESRSITEHELVLSDELMKRIDENSITREQLETDEDEDEADEFDEYE